MLKVKPFRVVPSADNNRYYVRGPGGKGFGSFVSFSHARQKCLELNAAFHLIWYARELVQDREPMTKEALG